MTKQGCVQQLRNELIQRLADDWPTHWKDKGHGREFINFGYVKNKNSFYAELKDEVDQTLVARFGLVEAAERSISADSIRRMLDERYQSGFSDKIKDAISIYLGYDSWEDFKTHTQPVSSTMNQPVVINHVKIVSIIPHPETVQNWWQHQRLEVAQNPGRKNQWWWAIRLLLLLTLSCGAYIGYDYWRQHRTFSPDELAHVKLKTLSRTNRYNPCIVTFTYDFSHLTIDSVQVNFGGNAGRADEQKKILRSPAGSFEFSFYKPGIHTLSMTYGNQLLKTIYVFVESDGWAAWYDHFTRQSTNFRKKDFYANGALFLHPNKIINPVHRSYYYSHFRNTRDFGINMNDCTVEYRIKNSPDEFAISCYETIMHLTDNRAQNLRIEFFRKGCEKATRIGEITTRLVFLHTLADWHIVRLVSKANRLLTYIDGQLIGQNSHRETFKRLNCLTIDSKGSCMVDYVRVYDRDGKLTYSDDFETVPVSTIDGY